MKALAVVALLAVALSGCISASDVGLTAKEAAAKALPKAQAWHADAVLVGLGTFESRELGNRTEGYGTAPFNATVLSDPQPGDGRSRAWGLAYWSAGANRSLAVVVYGNGSVLSDETKDHSDQQPVSLWEVDSPRAMDIAKTEANFSAVVQDPRAEVAMGMGMGDRGQGGGFAAGDPVWGIMAFVRGARSFAGVVVDARTGEHLAMPMGPWFGGDFGDLGAGSGYGSGCCGGMGGSTGANATSPRHYSFQGTVDPTNAPTAEHPFEVGPGHRTIEAQFRFQGALPTDGASLTVLDPEGNEIEAPGSQGAVPGGSGNGSADVTYAADGPGTYTAVVAYTTSTPVALPAGAQTSYTLGITVR